MKPLGQPTLRLPMGNDDPKAKVSMTVNGHPVSAEVSVRMLLSDFIREELKLTGTHVGCEHGVCGACTVLINGQSARSCLTFAVQAEGASITTIEAEANADGTLSVLQKAFRDHHGLQCGYCTPGMIMAVRSHINSGEKIDLSDDGIREVLSGNLCRCTGYAGIIDAVRAAAKELGLGR